jgi:hypothetical protein
VSVHQCNEGVTQSLSHSTTVSLCHSTTQSLCHAVTLPLSHSATQSLSHSVTQSLSHSVTPCHGISIVCVHVQKLCITKNKTNEAKKQSNLQNTEAKKQQSYAFSLYILTLASKIIHIKVYSTNRLLWFWRCRCEANR